MTAPDRATYEQRIAERYASVLDEVSRCAQAARDGDWRSLASTADDLSRRAAELTEVVGDLRSSGAQPRAHVVADMVARHTRGSRTAALAPPAGGDAIAKTPMTDPFTHPSSHASR
ncbi:MAG TPA: hypothetical protein VK453_29235 [Micromonosporaceae bacterium]|nr:hypothetical protein [Micromonosporaceae bacterium]